MKPKLLILISILLVVIASACTTVSNNSKNGLEVIPASYDFGNIKASDGVVTHSFVIKNIGSKTINILGVSTSCGCTSANVDKESLAPGETANLNATFDPNAHEGLTGLLKRIVYIRTDNEAEPETQIKLTVTVEEEHKEDHDTDLKDFEMSPFGLLEKINSKEDIKIIDVRPASEYGAGHIPGAINIDISDLDETFLSGLDIKKSDAMVVYGKSDISGMQGYDALVKLGYSEAKELMGGFTHWEEEGYDTETGKPSSEGTVAAGKGSKISFDKDFYDLGEVRQFGGVVSTSFTVYNNGDEDLVIKSLSTSCGCTSADIGDKVIKPGSSTTLNVHFDPNFHKEPNGIFKRTVFLETNDPANPEAEVRIQIEVLEGQ